MTDSLVTDALPFRLGPSNGDELHAGRVQRIARQLAAHDAARPLSLKKKAVAHQVPKFRDLRRQDDKIDISDFNHILEIDPVSRTCTAEAGVTFCDLVDATMKHGLVPIVVPELKTITIGGAVSGCSLESMSFRYGGFHDTCLEYEVVTTDGDVLRLRPEGEHAHLFQMIHGSFGTLGVLTKLTFRLVPAKAFVHVTYEKHTTLDAYMAAMRAYAKDETLDFMDGIIHSPTEYVLSLGRFVDEAPYTNAYDWTKVYYLSTKERADDYLKTPDYFFRYDRGVTNVHPKSYVGRLLFGKLLDSSTLLRVADRLHMFLSPDRPNVTLDVFLPSTKLADFFAWYRQKIDFFPLWFVPYRRVRDYEWIADGYLDQVAGDDMFVDIAIYGCEQAPGRNYYREIEDKLIGISGIKTLISHNYFDEKTFWKVWNKPKYDAAKAVLDRRNLQRDLYEKTCRATQGRTSRTNEPH
jgi:FAD/FMN-containing dehydrogenase